MSNSPSLITFILTLIFVYIVGICVGYSTRDNLHTRTNHVTCYVDGNHIHCLERPRSSHRQPVEVYRINRERVGQ